MFEYNFCQKTARQRPFKNGHFVKVCKEKMMDHQYKKNGAKNICSNYVDALQIYKKIIHFHCAVDETSKIPKKFWPFLYLNFTRVLQFSSTSPRL